jgi:hypothetical protein
VDAFLFSVFLTAGLFEGFKTHARGDVRGIVTGNLLKAKRADHVGIGINIAADNLGLEDAAAGLSGVKDKYVKDILHTLLHRWDDYFLHLENLQIERAEKHLQRQDEGA